MTHLFLRLMLALGILLMTEIPSSAETLQQLIAAGYEIKAAVVTHTGSTEYVRIFVQLKSSAFICGGPSNTCEKI